MATVGQPPFFSQQFFDGPVPAAGAKLYAYYANTQTPAPIYTDNTGTAETTEPIILSASGMCSYWMDVTITYKFVLLRANGSSINTWNYISAASASATIGPAGQNGTLYASTATGAYNGTIGNFSFNLQPGFGYQSTT